MNDTGTYQIKLRGQIDPVELNKVLPVAVRIEKIDADETLLSVCTDQSGLVGLARHLHARGLVFLSLSRERLASWKSLYNLAFIAVLLQLATVVGIIFSALALPVPESVEAYFRLVQTNKAAIFFGDEALSLLIVLLYLGVIPGLYAALRSITPAFTALAAVMTFMGVTICGITNSVFAMIHLSDLFAAAASEAQQAQLLAAGEAVLASNMWNSSGAYLAGILLQGSGILLSAIMLRSRSFGRITALTGILANGLDLAQHLLHPFLPELAGVITPLAGLSYLVWLPFLARDLYRLVHGRQAVVTKTQPRSVESL